jgi:hypothetical protein
LADALAYVDQQSKKEHPDGGGRMMESDARLGVPEMAWRIQHQFKQLEGLHFTSGRLKDQNMKIVDAVQDIDLRLDRSGAELRSEASLRAAASISPSYLVRGPYLLFMRLRSSSRPFFAVW